MNIIKIRDSSFSLITWYQSPKGGPFFFFLVIVFPSGHFILLLKPSSVESPRCRRRRISLLSITFPAGNLRFRGPRGRSLRWRKPRRKTALHAQPRTALLRRLAFHSPARVCTCGRVAHFPVTRFHIQARPALSC